MQIASVCRCQRGLHNIFRCCLSITTLPTRMMFSRSRQLVKKYLCSSPEVDAKRQMLDGVKEWFSRPERRWDHSFCMMIWYRAIFYEWTELGIEEREVWEGPSLIILYYAISTFSLRSSAIGTEHTWMRMGHVIFLMMIMPGQQIVTLFISHL